MWEPGDREEGRLAPPNKHLIGVWMPASFIDPRERSNQKLKSEGSAEGEALGKSSERVFSLAKTSPREGCVNLIY